MSEKSAAVEDATVESTEDNSAENTENSVGIAETTADKTAAKENPIVRYIKEQGWVYCLSMAVLVAVLIAALLISVTVIALPKNITVEAGDTPNYSYITQNGFWNSVCEVVTDLSAVDTSTVGVKTAQLRFFGFIDVKSNINVVDTVQPQITVRDVYVTPGVTVSAEMFVAEAVDATDVAYKFVEDHADTDSAGEYKVTISATDGGGNLTTADAVLTVLDTADEFSFEYGTSCEDIAALITDSVGLSAELDMSSVGDCGNFVVTAETETELYYIGVSIRDTVPPKAEVMSYDLVVGDEVREADLLADIVDSSEVTSVFGELPDFGKAGEYAVAITLTDAEGNTAEYISSIRVHDISTEITADVLSTNEALAELIFNDEWSADKLSFGNGAVSETLAIGENTVTLVGEYSNIEIKLIGVDTTPPSLRLKDIYRTVGTEIYPEDFVLMCTDVSEVTYSFAQKPASDTEGRFMVTVSAVDSFGNETVAYANVHYYADRSMPVIHGTRNISAIIGDTPQYFKNVYATDDSDANVKLTVNTDEVDFTSPGVYPITYIAVDESGNETRETVLLELVERIYVCLDVENILQNPRLPNGCEVVSLAIALGYEGYEVDPVELFENYMPKSPFNSNGDPWTAYIGDPRGYGLGCYAPCIVTTGNAYLSDAGSSLIVENVSGLSLSDYESIIDSGTPVIMWGLLNMNGSNHVYKTWYVNGEEVVWHSNSHCLVMIGYTNSTYIFCDPMRGIVEYGREAVEKSFEINFRQACVIVDADD